MLDMNGLRLAAIGNNHERPFLVEMSRWSLTAAERPIAVIDKHAGHVLQIIATKKRLFHKRALENS